MAHWKILFLAKVIRQLVSELEARNKWPPPNLQQIPKVEDQLAACKAKLEFLIKFIMHWVRDTSKVEHLVRVF